MKNSAVKYRDDHSETFVCGNQTKTRYKNVHEIHISVYGGAFLMTLGYNSGSFVCFLAAVLDVVRGTTAVICGC